MSMSWNLQRSIRQLWAASSEQGAQTTQVHSNFSRPVITLLLKQLYQFLFNKNSIKKAKKPHQK